MESQTITTRRKAPTAPATAQIHPDSLIRIAQILGTAGNPPLLAIGKTKFYSLVQQGKLPRPRKMGARMAVWRAGDILDAIAKLGAEQ